MKFKISSLLVLAVFVFEISAFSQTTVKDELENVREAIKTQRNKFNWESFDTTSKVAIDKITPETIRGSWKAYNGIFRFGNLVNSMELTQPIIIEIEGTKFRRNKDSEFEEFTLTGQQISFKAEGDVGIINKITDKLLVITWKHGGNYTRYYYEK